MIGNLINRPAWGFGLLDDLAKVLVVAFVPSAASLSLAVLALRLRRPRSRWRRMIRQPGLIACLAALGGLAVGLVYTAFNVLENARMITRPPGEVPYASDPTNWILTFDWSGPLPAGFAVAVAWSTQALVGRWRAEPSWIDRLGRLVGVGWMALGVAGWYLIRAMSV